LRPCYIRNQRSSGRHGSTYIGSNIRFGLSTRTGRRPRINCDLLLNEKYVSAPRAALIDDQGLREGAKCRIAKLIKVKVLVAAGSLLFCRSGGPLTPFVAVPVLRRTLSSARLGPLRAMLI
jgi:hypothetical protein